MNKLKISENTVVHCETEQDVIDLFMLANDLGLRWQNGNSYLDVSNRPDYCYDLHNGGRACKEYYMEKEYKIISAQDFIALHTKNKFPSTKEIRDSFKQYLEETPKDILQAKINKFEGIKESDGKLNYELDFEFIQAMAERMSKNKNKYPPYNWKLPINVESLKQSLFRHTIEVMKSNYSEDDRDYAHFESIALNCMMIVYQLKHNDNSRTT